MEQIWNSSSMRSFVAQVQEKAQLSSADEAEQLTRAALGVLAESISGGQVDDLLRGLPAELRDELSQRSGQARSVDRLGFLDRVSGHVTATDISTIETQTRAVFSVLYQWAPEGEIDDTVAQLPPAIAELFE